MTSTSNPDEMATAARASHGMTDPVSFASLGGPVSPGLEGDNVDRRPAIDPVADEAGPMGLASTQPVSASPADEPNSAIRQIEGILANLTTYATPVLREIAARAADLAAKAADAAAPAAHKAAGVTDQIGTRVAAKGREIASDLRGDLGADDPGGPSASSSEPGGWPS